METITALGQSWPIETFLDAHRFERCDGDAPEIAEYDHPIRCVTRDLQIIEPIARHAPWHDVVAFRAPDLSPHFDECDACGSVSVLNQGYVIAAPTKENPEAKRVHEICPKCGDPDDRDDEWDWM